MFSNSNANSKALAFALVAMLSICSLAVVLCDESDAENEGPFDIYMRVGDGFAYTPKVNLSGSTIAPTGTAMNHLTDDDGTITGSFTESGDYNLKLTATWVSPENQNLTQTAEQYINFHVYDWIQFDGAQQAGDIQVNKVIMTEDLDTVGEAVYTIAFEDTLRLPEGAAFGTPTFKFNGGADNGLFSWDATSKSVELAREITDGDDGQYTVTIPASYSYNGITDSATATLSIMVADDVVVLSDLIVELDLSPDSPTTYTIETNFDGISDLEYTVDVEEAYKALVSNNGATVTFNLDSAESLFGSTDEKITFNMNITVSGDVDSDGYDEQGTAVVRVDVYRELGFTNRPTMSDVDVLSLSGDPLSVMVSASIGSATKVTYHWGDGKYSVKDGIVTGSAPLGAQYTYDRPGIYEIAIVAENDAGSTVYRVLYDASNGEWAFGGNEDVGGDESFLEEHGILFIILIILAIVLFVLFFCGIVAVPQILVVGVVLVIAGVACFVTGDFGLTSGLFGE